MKSSSAASAACSSLASSFRFLLLIIRRQGSFTAGIAIEVGADVINADASVVNHRGGVDTNAGLLRTRLSQ